ncbi:UNVERIFIED_CONTAM: putative membrane protein [Sesamum calycinum]|uniref:Membrane protein n=1 Tax=Sesamum calycinum TaxID=2727403 RepID=A0AAW2NDE7_9LAMI
MAALRRKGKFLFVLSVCLLFSDSFYSPRFSCLNVLASDIDPSLNSNSVKETDSRNGNNLKEKSLDKESENPDVVLLKKQQFQLEKLEELVKNLTQLVDKLESRFTEAPEKEKTVPSSSSHDETRDAERKKEEPRTPSEEGEEQEQEQGKGVKGGAGRGGGEGPVLVKKYNTFWSERFQFVSAVKLRSSPTCFNVLPYRDFEGFSKYFAVGDDTGKLYVFLRSGDVALEFDTFLESEGWSPITAMVSYLSVYKNESMIITGHENGDILMLRVWETLTGDEWSSLHVERVGKFDMPESGGSQINILEVHHVGRKRYILATDAGGKIFVFRENGTVYGTATPSRRPIAFLKQRLLFLTETGAGSLDLRTMKLKESECEGFNSSSAKNYVFDATDRSKAYGFTLQGELIQTLLLGDIMNFKCRVRSKRKLDIDKPMALHAIKGYLLIANREKVVVYNVSSQHYVRSGGVRLVFSAGLDEIIGSFLHQQASDVEDEKRMQTPLIASDYEKLVIVSLGNGYVAMYRSKLPVFKNEFNSILWTSPVLFFILFLFGAWHFFANKKEVLTSWGPDDPFSSASVTGGAPLGSGSGDRSFTDTSRTSDIMDLRGSGLRGPSRYVSPPRFPGGTANSYRPGPDTDSRPAPVDPRFRATSELKFRGSNVESAGIPKRRESLFGNSQVVDDSN